MTRGGLAACAGAIVVALTLSGCATMAFTTSAREPAPPARSSVAVPVPSTPPPATPTPTPPPALLTPSSADSAPTTKPAPVGAYILGDSISLGVAPLLSRLGYPVVGKVGQSASDAYLRDNLATDQAQAALAWVVILGTNNRGDAADIAAIPHWLDLIDDLRPKDIPVYWVTPYRPPTYTGGLSRVTLDEFNAELKQQATTRPWLGIVDFATVAEFHPEWFAADGEHLHPDAAGQSVLAAMIAGPDAALAAAPAPVTSLSPTDPAMKAAEPQDEPTTFTNVPVPVSTPAPTQQPVEPEPVTSEAAPPAPEPLTSAAPSG